MDVNEAMTLLVHDAEFRAAIYAPQDVFIHAAVVGWCGRAIIIPGRSFSGKSTLAVELLRRGALYFSDEYAVLDFAGRVHPYARPISIRNERNPATKHPVDPVRVGGRGGPLPVALVVMSEFRSGGVWRPRRLSPLPVPLRSGRSRRAYARRPQHNCGPRCATLLLAGG